MNHSCMRRESRWPLRRLTRANHWSALKRGSRVAALAGALLLMLALGGVGQASATASPACGDTVTADVTLTADLVCPSGTGLYVVPRIVVDFAGHSLRGGGTGVGVFGGDTTTVLRNGKIAGFGTGIAEGLTVEQMVIAGNGTGIAAINSKLVINGSSISDNDGDGVRANGGASITDSSIVRNGGRAIYSLQGLAMTGSNVSDNGGHGAHKFSPAVELLNNVVSLDNNVFKNNDVDIFTPYADPIYISNNRFINSAITIFTNGQIIDGRGNAGNHCGTQIFCGHSQGDH
jgi:hypothetical protein